MKRIVKKQMPVTWAKLLAEYEVVCRKTCLIISNKQPSLFLSNYTAKPLLLHKRLWCGWQQDLRALFRQASLLSQSNQRIRSWARQHHSGLGMRDLRHGTKCFQFYDKTGTLQV